MKILLFVTACIVIVNVNAVKEKKITTAVAEISGNGSRSEVVKETRGKRNLNLFGNFVSNRREDAYNQKPSGYNYDTNNYISSGSASDNHNYHRNQHHHHYPEPPEPIIEIIIQDNNETLPQPILQSNGNEKKEQVQVFYVKYHKDEHKGLVIHEPVAALSPAGHEQNEPDDHHHQDFTIVTPAPNIPRQTTTLRTIIHPDSEKYESSSGVHVTFNKPHNHHSKSDNNIHDEEKVESAIQPVIQLPQNRVGPISVLPIKEKRQQPPFSQGGNFQNVPQNHAQLHQRLPEVVSQNNFISHSHQPFLTNQLTLPSQEPSKPFHPNSPFIFNNNNNNNHINNQPQLNRQPIPIPINHHHHHHQNQHGVLGHQQQISQRLPPLQGSSASQQPPPQRNTAPQANFNLNQKPFNYHAHSSQAQNIQRPQPISPPRQGLPQQNFHNFNQQLPPLNRPVVQFNTQYPTQHQLSSIQFPPNQGPPLNFKPESKIPLPSKTVNSQPSHNQFIQPPVHNANNNGNVFQGGLVEQEAPNLTLRPAQYQQLPQQAPPLPFLNSPPQQDIHFNQQKFIQSTFGTDIQVSSSVPKFEHHITETVNPPVYFQPTALDMDKVKTHHQDTAKNVGSVGQLLVTQKPLTQHRFAPQRPNNNHLSFPTQQNYYQTSANNFVDISGRNNNYVTNAPLPQKSTTITPIVQTTTRPITTTSTSTTTEKQPISSNTSAKSQAYYQLPEEIPDDLRKQLEESGVLENAHISILDYDKIGDTSLQDLPAEHLANFFSAGGGAQIGANSNKVISLLKPNGESIGNQIDKNKDFSKLIGVSKKEDVNVRVVKFDMQSPEMSVNQKHSRYLPIKINGAQFPISGMAELKEKKIVSVVLLAPVEDDSDGGHSEKDTFEAGQIKFLSGETLKNLIKKPSSENFRKWFEHEQKAIAELQSIVLLVTKDNFTNEKEIFMYDISNKSTSHLNGNLSQKFVDVAEENSNAQDEIRQPFNEQIDRIDRNLEPLVDESVMDEAVVNLNGEPINSSGKRENQVLITSGYSVIKND